MHTRSIPFNSSTDGTVESVLSKCIAAEQANMDAKSLSLMLEFHESATRLYCSPTVEAQLRQLLARAISVCVAGDTIEVDVLETAKGLEIEVSCPQDLPGAQASFARDCDGQVEGKAANENADITNVRMSRCPQGGTAWTLVSRLNQAARKVA